jgi:hypothetical protein
VSVDDESVPAADAIRSLEYDRLRVAMRDRDQYRTWFEKLSQAMADYIATVQPMLGRNPWTNANSARVSKADERRARAAAYRAAGMSWSKIGLVMGLEDGRGALRR